MSNEFKHKDAGTQLTRTEDNAVDRHEADGETANDMIYFNGTSWIRATPATIRTLLSIIAKTLFDANTILKADSDNTPIALAIAEQRIVGRITDGSITALTATQIRTLLNIEDGSTADLTGAEIVVLLEALTAANRLDHGAGLTGLTGDDHTQYILHSLADAANDFLVASAADTFVKKTLAQTLTILGKAVASGLASLGATSKVVQQPASITDHLDGSPDEDDATKAPTSEWAFDHNANTTTAHGAVSTATASKIVVRDAQGQAAFAAPAAAGDALIRGTRHLIAEMPTLTTDKTWKGVGGVPAEVDWPAAGGATLTVAETEVFNGTSPTSWTDLDLSGTIGSNAALVLLKFAGGIDDEGFAVRKNGDTDEFYIAAALEAHGVALAQFGNVACHIVLLAATDTVGKIEWITEAAKTYTVDIIAYIK